MQTFLQDLRYGARMLFKQPGFTLVAVLTLALGIGANTAIFSVINGVLLRPLPYPEAEQLVLYNERSRQMDGMSISWPNYMDWRAQQDVFQDMGVFNRADYNLTGAGEPERIQAGQVTASLFTTLRVRAAIGRVFNADEDKPGGPLVVLLSHGLWQRRFGGQPGIVGQALNFNGRDYTVLGVMPENFRLPRLVEMWTPAGQLSDQASWKERGNHPGLYGVARLKPGVSLEQASAAMDNIAAGLEKLHPNSNKDNRLRIIPLLENYVSDVRGALQVLAGAVGFVLLIACANIANLLLARASTRRREMAIRAALGAGRWRIVRQLLTESVLLALLGGGLGLLLATWGVDLILRTSPDAIPRAREIGLDNRVFGFTFAVSLLTGLIFGLIPAWQASRVDVHETLKEGGRGNSGARQWLRGSLVVTEIAAALVLLVGAGLLIRSFYRLYHVNPGFSYERLWSANITLPGKKYDLDRQIAFWRQLTERLGAMPGVEAASVASGLPLGNNGWQTSFAVEGRPAPPPGQSPLMEACLVSPDYFRAMGIPLRAGRYFNEQDNRQHLNGRDLSKLGEEERAAAGVNVVIIDEDFARRHWPGEEAVGKRIQLGGGVVDINLPLATVVGVVGRVEMETLRGGGFAQGYFCSLQLPRTGMTTVIKSRVDPASLTAAVRAQVAALDPVQPIFGVRTMEEIRDESVANEKLNVMLLLIFAAVAAALALVGIYGVMSYAVTQRTQEIGIRLSLGAQRRDVLRMVVGQGMRLAALGIGLGLGLALALSWVMRALLFGVSATDPITFATVAGVLALVALVACWIPARRATKVDPLVALRCE
ncbi:MAG: ABC transporter permease [Blastocatellia bacterium]